VRQPGTWQTSLTQSSPGQQAAPPAQLFPLVGQGVHFFAAPSHTVPPGQSACEAQPHVPSAPQAWPLDEPAQLTHKPEAPQAVVAVPAAHRPSAPQQPEAHDCAVQAAMQRCWAGSQRFPPSQSLELLQPQAPETQAWPCDEEEQLQVLACARSGLGWPRSTADVVWSSSAVRSGSGAMSCGVASPPQA
jgi:hypothetical protein